MVRILPNYRLVKRVGDIAVASVGLVILSPVIVATAATVAVKLGRPVLFKQQRPGLDGKPFELMKFRSMLEVDEDKGLVTNEERMTSFGKALRATSLDELPSFWNVIRGEMSLVGPRPLLMDYLEHYTPRQARRHEVRPGITGLAQVNGRNAISWEDKFELDVQYVEGISFRLDLKILASTIGKVLKRDGIASEGTVVGARFEGSLSK